jgi:alpha-glucosidase
MPWEAAKAHAGFTTAEKSWLPVPYEQAALSVDVQEGDDSSVLSHYRDTLAFRKAHPALIDGAMTFLDTNQDLLVFTRKKESETLLFVFNLTREAAAFSLPAGMVPGERLEMPGAGGTVDGGKVVLGALEGFCARVA